MGNCVISKPVTERDRADGKAPAYLPGETVRGHVDVALSQDYDIWAFYLAVQGEAHERWEESDGETTTIVTNNTPFSSINMNFIGKPAQRDGKHKLAAGKHRFPFEFDLSKKALPSGGVCCSTHVAIRWTLQAKAEVSSGVDRKSDPQFLDVLALVPPSRVPETSDIITKEGEASLPVEFCCCCDRGTVRTQLIARAPKLLVLNSHDDANNNSNGVVTPIEVDVLVENGSRKEKIDAVHVDLCCQANCLVGRKKSVTGVVLRHSVKGSSVVATGGGQLKFSTTLLAATNKCGCYNFPAVGAGAGSMGDSSSKVVEFRYYFRVRVDAAGCCTEIKLPPAAWVMAGSEVCHGFASQQQQRQLSPAAAAAAVYTGVPVDAAAESRAITGAAIDALGAGAATRTAADVAPFDGREESSDFSQAASAAY